MHEAINVSEINSINEIFNDKLVAIDIGYDSKIYFLFCQNIPEHITRSFFGMTAYFFNPIAHSEFSGIVVDVNYEAGSILHRTDLTFGEKTLNFHSFLPLGSNYVLSCPRVYYDGENTLKNLQIVDQNGTIINEFCIGDGVSQIKTTTDGKIIVGYIDEGVMGNYGWNSPIGHTGLNVYNQAGELIWSNKNHYIDECYALNIDDQNNLYFYYYGAFNLVKTNMIDKEIVMKPDISGSNAIFISQDEKKICISGGYDNNTSFFCLDFDDKNLSMKNKREVDFISQEQKIVPSRLFSNGSYLIIFEATGKKYIGRFH